MVVTTINDVFVKVSETHFIAHGVISPLLLYSGCNRQLHIKTFF